MISSPDLDKISFASSEFVPSNLTITGTFNPNSPTASMTPLATRSHRTIPPKILIKIALTFLSERMILNPFFTVSAEAAPPTSKKFAGSPPASLIYPLLP